VAQHLHDGVQLGAAFGELGSDGVPESVGGNGAANARAALLAARNYQSDLFAGLLDRGVEQVEQRQQLAVVHEQVADLLAGAFVGERPFGAVLAQVDDFLQGVPGVLVEGNHPLLVGLAAGQPQPWCPVGVVVQAVQWQVPDLVSAGPGPAGDQQRRPLERAGDLVDDGHHQVEFVAGDEAGNPPRQLGGVAGGDGRIPGDVGVLPGCGVTEHL